MQNERELKAAVVVPIKNEREGLLSLAAGLLGQSRPPDEVIFVDAGSTDGGPEQLESAYRGESRVRVLRAPGVFPGEGRNVAIRSTDADVIAQIDGGNAADHFWLERLCAPIAAGAADYAAGGIRIMPIWKELCGVRLDVGQIYGASLFRRFQTESAVAGGGAGVAYRREIWERVGGFPGRYRFGSDPLFARKAARLKVRTAFVPEAVIFWQIGPRFVDIVERQFRYQRAKFRQPEGIARFRGTLLLPLAAAACALLALRHPAAWGGVALLALLYWARQCRKVYRTYRERSAGEAGPRGRLCVLAIIGAVESVHVLSRVAGSVVGLLDLRHRAARAREMEEYLESTPGGGAA